ncbi:MAG: creatininase family protein [Clostridia bacterium]|nr:creatininase family protein [Clostridia bacterium]
MKLNMLKYTEIKEYLKEKDSLLIPIGTCEQHGLHLPLCTDTIVAEKMCDEISDKYGILVAPTVNYGINLPLDNNTMTGTTGISYEVLKETLRSITEYWNKQGFKHFFAVSCHGDIFHIKALQDSSKNIEVIETYEVEQKDLLEKQVCTRHACESETSVMLYLYPELVDMSVARDFDISIDIFMPYLEHKKTEVIDGYIGNVGYSTLATREKGKAIYERMLKNLENVIKNVGVI